jgi:chloramphenicol O-acetyltransferase type A
MTFREIDMTLSPRRAHFDHFRHAPDPHVGLTVDVDVTDLAELCRERGWSFYLAFIRVACEAANAVPELRRRLRGDRVVEYDRCDTSHIELLDNGTYCYCTLRHDPSRSWDDYMAYALAQRQAARAAAGIEEEQDVEGMYFISTVPWLHYRDFSQPNFGPEASNPSICWGKYLPDHRGRLMMPLTLYCHHALADGLQIAQFYSEIESCLQHISIRNT